MQRLTCRLQTVSDITLVFPLTDLMFFILQEEKRLSVQNFRFVFFSFYYIIMFLLSFIVSEASFAFKLIHFILITVNSSMTPHFTHRFWPALWR